MDQMNGRIAKTLVVTDASAGIGRAVARAFGRRGDRVALIARGRPGPEAAEREVDRPLAEDRQDNLWTAVEEDRGAHGPSDDRAEDRSVQLQLNKRLPWLLAGAGAIALAAALRGMNAEEPDQSAVSTPRISASLNV